MGQSEDTTFPSSEDVNYSEDQFPDYGGGDGGGDGGGGGGEGQGQEGRDSEQNSGEVDQETTATQESLGKTIEGGSSAQSYDDALESYSVVIGEEDETLETTGSPDTNANSTVFHVNTKASATGTENVTLDAIHEEGAVTTDSPSKTLNSPTPRHAYDGSNDVQHSKNTSMFVGPKKDEENIDLGAAVANTSRLRSSSKSKSESPNEGTPPVRLLHFSFCRTLNRQRQ